MTENSQNFARCLSEIQNGDTIYLIQNETTNPEYIEAKVKNIIDYIDMGDKDVLQVSVILDGVEDEPELITFIADKAAKSTKDIKNENYSYVFLNKEDAEKYIEEKKIFNAIKPLVDLEVGDRVLIYIFRYNEKVNLEYPAYIVAYVSKIYDRKQTADKWTIEFEVKVNSDDDGYWCMINIDDKNAIFCNDLDSFLGYAISTSEQRMIDCCQNQKKMIENSILCEIDNLKQKLEFCANYNNYKKS